MSIAPERLWRFVLLSLLLHLLVISLLVWQERARVMPEEAITVELLPPPPPPSAVREAEPQPTPSVEEPPPLLTSEQSVIAPAATPEHTPIPPPQETETPAENPPAENPPAENPPAENPPVENPPVEKRLTQKSPPARALRPTPVPAPALAPDLAQPPSAGGEGQGDGKIAQLHNAYLAQIAAQLMQQKCRLFSPASMRNLFGVELILRLDQEGHMQNFTITRGSGSAAVDHSVAQLVARAGRFPPLPPEIDSSGMFIVRFRERDALNGGGCPGWQAPATLPG